jgi:hypothetical protein
VKLPHNLSLSFCLEPPSVSPQISGLPAQLPLNKWVKLTCSLPWMNVKPKLEFFVNGKKAKHKVTGKEKSCQVCLSI